MTTNQIIAAVRNRVLETTTEIVTDSTLLLYINETYKDLCKRIFPNDHIESATVAFTNGVGTLPTDFGTLYGDAVEGTNNYFPELSIDDFNKETASQGITIEGGQLKVYPTTTASLSIKYYATFPELSTSVNPTINSYFHFPIIYGAVSMTYEDLQDEELSKYYYDKYETEVARRMSTQSQYEEGNQRGGQLFAGQNLIGGIYGQEDPNYF